MIEDKLIKLLPANVILNKTNTNPPREEYEARVKEMDYILLPYHMDYYKVTASGAVFEA